MAFGDARAARTRSIEKSAIAEVPVKIALLAVGGEIIYSIAATTHGSTPARVVQVQAGPYPLTVSLYTYPAHASYALPFAIAPQQSIKGTLTYEVSSIPDPSDVPATPVRASLGPDSNVRNGVQGDAEITVQGWWSLVIIVTGSAGQGEAVVPITATAPPAIPDRARTRAAPGIDGAGDPGRPHSAQARSDPGASQSPRPPG